MKIKKAIRSIASMTIFIILAIIVVFLFKSCSSDHSDLDNPYLLKRTWEYKTSSSSKYHDPLNVTIVKETDEVLEFDVVCHMNLKDNTTRECIFRYSLNKGGEEGTFHSKVIGFLNNGTRVMRGKIRLEKRSDKKLTFSYVVDQDHVWSRLKPMPMSENSSGQFVLVAD